MVVVVLVASDGNPIGAVAVVDGIEIDGAVDPVVEIERALK